MTNMVISLELILGGLVVLISFELFRARALRYLMMRQEDTESDYEAERGPK